MEEYSIPTLIAVVPFKNKLDHFYLFFYQLHTFTVGFNFTLNYIIKGDLDFFQFVKKAAKAFGRSCS